MQRTALTEVVLTFLDLNVTPNTGEEGWADMQELLSAPNEKDFTRGAQFLES